MLDMTTKRGRIIAAALSLAGRQGWRDTGLGEIASEAGLNLAELREEFRGKAEILAAFTRAADDEVLKRTGKPETGETPRDRLFDVIMTRFEVLAPYKPALRRIYADLRFTPAAACRQLEAAFKSQHWMLAAAGIGTEGVRGKLRLKGMTATYARVFGIWLEDDDPGHARTMAALDRRLRRGERIMRRVDGACNAAGELLGGWRSRRHAPPGSAADEPPPSGASGPAAPASGL